MLSAFALQSIHYPTYTCTITLLYTYHISVTKFPVTYTVMNQSSNNTNKQRDNTSDSRLAYQWAYDKLYEALPNTRFTGGLWLLQLIIAEYMVARDLQYQLPELIRLFINTIPTPNTVLNSTQITQLHLNGTLLIYSHMVILRLIDNPNHIISVIKQKIRNTLKLSTLHFITEILQHVSWQHLIDPTNQLPKYVANAEHRLLNSSATSSNPTTSTQQIHNNPSSSFQPIRNNPTTSTQRVRVPILPLPTNTPKPQPLLQLPTTTSTPEPLLLISFDNTNSSNTSTSSELKRNISLLQPEKLLNSQPTPSSALATQLKVTDGASTSQPATTGDILSKTRSKLTTKTYSRSKLTKQRLTKPTSTKQTLPRKKFKRDSDSSISSASSNSSSNSRSNSLSSSTIDTDTIYRSD